MLGSKRTDFCPALGGAVNIGALEIIKSALHGCSEDDGIIDSWFDHLDLSVVAYGFRSAPFVRIVADFNDSKQQILHSVSSLEPGGDSPSVSGLHTAATSFDSYFNTSNSSPDSPNTIILLTDGARHATQPSPAFDSECNRTSIDQPDLESAVRYLSDHDMLCSLPGEQSISTYIVGLGMPGAIDISVLSAAAVAGKGNFFYAPSVSILQAAITDILSDISSD